MADERPGKPWWMGTPETFVLYRTAESWRYALYLRDPQGVVDGRVREIPPTSAPEDAQAELHRRTELAHRRRLEVNWQAGHKPDWWTGEVVDVGPLPVDDGADEQPHQHSKKPPNS